MTADVSERRVRAAAFVKAIPVLGPVVRHLYRRLRAYRENRAFSVRAVTRRNTRRAYERLFGSDELLDEYLSSARLSFYEEVADVCVGLAPRRIVDVGCGSGDLLCALANRLPDATFVGVDFSKNAIRRARDRLLEAHWLVGDAYDPPLEPHTFDLVLCTEVLEHLKRPREAVDALARLCAPGGHVVLAVPDGELDRWQGHVNFWSEGELAAFLDPVGNADIRRISGDRALLAILSP